jgi:hypothetical protein
MGLWAIWTWSQEREQERQTGRARLAALYVNPFMSACEDLQSRIYNILELGGLRTLRKRYPDGAYAEEILYLIVRYFGWAAALSRYSPYSQDPVVIRLAEVSLLRGAAEPSHGFGWIAGDPVSLTVYFADVRHGHGVALLGGTPEPSHCFFIVAGGTDTTEIRRPKVVLRLGVALLARQP